MPRDLSSVRLARLNNLLRALASASIVTRAELIEMLGNHTGRTLERDLDYLRRHFEARISWDPRRKGYILNSPGTFVMRLTLSEREATALVAGLAMTRHFLPHLDAACEALWGKIRTVLPEKLAAEASHLAKSAVVSLPISAFDPAIFETLLRAIRTGHPVRGRYTSPYDADPVEKPVMLSPWGVFFRAHAWYLWAWSHSSGGERTYRISRFTDLYITDEPAVAPPEDRSVTGFAESAWYGFSGGVATDIALRVLPPLSRVVIETRWHASQTIENCDDGSIILRARVPNLEEVAKWVLASAPFAIALEPAALRERVEALATEVLEQRHDGV